MLILVCNHAVCLTYTYFTYHACLLKMKQQQHDINLRRTRKKKKKSESQMGFEPTTLCDLESPVAQVVRASD